MTKIHEDADGNKSSKRVYGAVMITSGVIMLWGIWLASLLIRHEIVNIDHAYDAAQLCIMFGSVLLGLGLGEKFNFKKK